MHQQVLLKFVGLCVLPISLCLTGPQIASHFEQVLSAGSQVHLLAEANYSSSFVQRWDLYNSPTYVVSVKPALESDVQEVVSLPPYHLSYFSYGRVLRSFTPNQAQVISFPQLTSTLLDFLQLRK